jgi:hypothetical protein
MLVSHPIIIETSEHINTCFLGGCGLIPLFQFGCAVAAAEHHPVCDAIPQALFRWRGPDQESAQEIPYGVVKMIDDAQQIANDGFSPTYGRAIQIDNTSANTYALQSGCC